MILSAILPGLFTGALSSSGAIAIMIGMFVSVIMALIPVLIVSGYGLDITRSTIDNKEDLPEIDIVNNFVLGIKSLVVQIIYLIIPIVVLSIIAFGFNLFQNFTKIVAMVNMYGAQNINYISQDVLSNFLIGASLMAIVGLVLIFVFGILLLTIGQCRLAKYDSIKSAIDIGEVLNDIGAIKWGRYIGYMIAIVLVIFITSVIVSLLLNVLLSIFGAFGVILSSLLTTFFVGTFFTLFRSRVIGLIYNLKEEV